jgi:hypothetical protein
MFSTKSLKKFLSWVSLELRNWMARDKDKDKERKDTSGLAL